MVGRERFLALLSVMLTIAGPLSSIAESAQEKRTVDFETAFDRKDTHPSVKAGEALGVTDSTPAANRKRKLYLHIGPHKTGTTYFQKWIKKQEGLSPSLVYPKACGVSRSTVWFGALAMKVCQLGMWEKWASKHCPPSLDELFRGLANLPEPADAIISTESISQCSEEGFIRLHELLRDHVDVHVILVKRESRSLMLSRWHQVNEMNDHKQQYLSSLELFSETYRLGDSHAKLCSYVSVECVRFLAGIFGPDRVTTLSYEGIIAAGKDLPQALCEEFSIEEACHVLQQPLGKTNKSAPHVQYSAAALFSRLRHLSGCKLEKDSHGGKDFGDHVLSFKSKSLKHWMIELELNNVGVNCLPLRSLRSRECDQCFLAEVQAGTVPGQHLYYEEAESYKDSAQLCEYDESSVYRDQDTLARVIGMVRNISGCL